MSYRIHVVTLPGEDFGGSYMLKLLCDLWREAGNEVTAGAVDRLDADLGILHIDRTWIPHQALPDNPRARPLLNGKVLDISKRHVSELIVDQNSDYQGPVIIKTNANSFGYRDLDRGRWSMFLRRRRQNLARRFSWQLARELQPGHYPILDSLQQVPAWLWNRPELVVEKFVPEIEDNLYVLRQWLFFGDREYGVKLWCESPVVKSTTTVRHVYLDEVPAELREMRRKLGFDFGKFDYVMADGRPVLVDANKTPWITSRGTTRGNNIANLAEGIHSCLESCAS